MATTDGNNTLFLDASNPGTVGLGLGNDRYVLSNTSLAANQTLTISDADGANTLQLVGGLTITSSLVSNNAIQLTLSNGAKVTVLGASTFTFLTGGDAFSGTGGVSQTFSQFVTVALGATVPAANAAAVPVGPVTLVSGGTTTPSTGQTFTLTNSVSGDVFTLTQGNDTVNGLAANLQAADVVSDGSTTDADVANLTLNGAALAARFTNIETINYSGEFATTGAALTNVTGTKVANFTTGIVGGTAALTDVSSGVATITLGTNVSTLTTTTLATGTNGTVTVNLGAATTAGVTGGLGNDTYIINSPNANSTLNLVGGAGTGVDVFTVNLTKGGTVAMTTDALIDTLTFNSTTAANTVNIGPNGGALLTAAGNATRAFVTGDQAFTLRANLDAVEGIRIDKTGTGLFTLRADADATAGAVLQAVAADVLDVRGALGAGAYVVNSGTKVLMNTGSTATATTVFNINNVAGNLATAGTLNLELAVATPNKLSFGANVSTVAITANAFNLTAAGIGAVADLDISTGAVTTATIAGNKNVTVSALNADANDVVSASGLTGDLTLTVTSNLAVTIVGGSGSDTITLSAGLAGGGIVAAGAGNDTVVGGALSNTLFGDAGNDNLTGGAAADTIDGGDGVDFLVGLAGGDVLNGGAGVDTINGGLGADTMTGGTDNDIFIFATATANESGGTTAALFDTITDFSAGDKIDIGAVFATTQATAAAAVGGTASISSNGLATFAAADSTLALKLIAVNAAIDAGGVAIGESAVFVDSGSTYLFVSGAAVAGAVANTDLLIRLVGVTATTGITVDSAGDITGIV